MAATIEFRVFNFGFRVSLIKTGIYRTSVRVFGVKSYPGPSSQSGNDPMAHNLPYPTLSIQWWP